MSSATFKLDPGETFEQLPNAPIVEAVIHWQATAEKDLEPDAFLDDLKSRLVDYPNSQRQQELDFGAEVGPGGSFLRHRHAWHGFRFESAEKLQIAQFTRNGFVFSRLKPYQAWDAFASEARRLWQVYRELAEPAEIQRLGVRFINLIPSVVPEQLGKLLTTPPRSPQRFELPVKEFMHRSAFDIPGHPYRLNVIQTIRPPSPPQADAHGLILDLDVFTSAVPFDAVEERLREMRWIKNKAFFSLLTEAAIARFTDPSK